MTAGLESWPAMKIAASANGIAPDDVLDLEARFEAVTGTGNDEAWEPSDLGELLACSIISVIVRTAPPERALAAYVAVENDDALDRIWDDLRASVLREVQKVAAA